MEMKEPDVKFFDNYRYLIINKCHQIAKLVIQPRLADIVKYAKATYLNLTLSDGM